MAARFGNSMPVYLLNPSGPAHALRDGQFTRCGMSAHRAKRATYAQVHVFLRHAMCLECFGPDGSRWP